MKGATANEPKAIVTFQLPRKILDRVDAEANRECLSRADVLRRILMRYLKDMDQAAQSDPRPAE